MEKEPRRKSLKQPDDPKLTALETDLDLVGQRLHEMRKDMAGLTEDPDILRLFEEGVETGIEAGKLKAEVAWRGTITSAGLPDDLGDNLLKLRNEIGEEIDKDPSKPSI